MSWLKRLFGIEELTPEERVLESLRNARRSLATVYAVGPEEQRRINNLIGRIDAMTARLIKEWRNSGVL